MDGAHWIVLWQSIAPVATAALAISMMKWMSYRSTAVTVRRTARIVAKLGKSARHD